MANDQLVSQLDSALADLKSSYDGLTEDQVGQVALDQWCVKDLLAHVTGWHYEMSRMLDRMLRGERPAPEGVSYDDVDAWNRQFVESRRGRSLIEVVTDLDTSYTELRSRVEALPADRLAPGKTAYRMLTTDTRDHYGEHANQIRAWRQAAGL